MPKVFVTRELNDSAATKSRAPKSHAQEIQAAGGANIEQTIEAGAKSVEVDVWSGPNVDYAWLSSNGDLDVLVVGPDPKVSKLIELRGVPFVWSRGCGFEMPFPGGVEDVFVTSKSDKPVDLIAQFLFSPVIAPESAAAAPAASPAPAVETKPAPATAAPAASTAAAPAAGAQPAK